MKILLLILALSPVFVGCAASKPTSQRSLSQATDSAEQLLGSAWMGTVESVGVSHQIRIGFLSERSASGALEYFHYLSAGQGVGELNKADPACQFTPRAISLVPTAEAGVYRGTIHVFLCAASAAQEEERAADPARPPLASVEVSTFALSADGQQLSIRAKIAGVNLTYSLDRQAVDSGIAADPARLRQWVTNP